MIISGDHMLKDGISSIIDRKEGWGHAGGSQAYSKDDGSNTTDISDIPAHQESKQATWIREQVAPLTNGIVPLANIPVDVDPASGLLPATTFSSVTMYNSLIDADMQVMVFPEGSNQPYMAFAMEGDTYPRFVMNSIDNGWYFGDGTFDLLLPGAGGSRSVGGVIWFSPNYIELRPPITSAPYRTLVEVTGDIDLYTHTVFGDSTPIESGLVFHNLSSSVLHRLKSGLTGNLYIEKLDVFNDDGTVVGTLPVGMSSTYTFTEKDDPIIGDDTKMQMFTFASDQTALAFGLEGDDYPRTVIGTDPDGAGCLFIGNGTFNPLSGEEGHAWLSYWNPGFVIDGGLTIKTGDLIARHDVQFGTDPAYGGISLSPDYTRYRLSIDNSGHYAAKQLNEDGNVVATIPVSITDLISIAIDDTFNINKTTESSGVVGVLQVDIDGGVIISSASNKTILMDSQTQFIADADFAGSPSGPILHSPNDTKYRIIVSNDGTLSTELVA